MEALMHIIICTRICNGIVYRENLEIGELEVLLSLPNFLHFKSDSANWLDSLSLSRNFSFLRSFNSQYANTHIHILSTNTLAFNAYKHSDLAVLSHEELLIQTIVKRKQAS